MQCISFLFILLLCSIAPPPARATPAAQPLAPFDYINGQLIDLDTGVQVYRLQDLKPSTGYEVRVSFPASIPATIKFAIVQPPGEAAAAATGSLQRPGRRLLDCEKLIFTTDAQGAVQGIAEPHVELRALRRSVHRDGPKAGAPKLVYNIVLAELVLGLPLDSIPTVVTIVVVVLVAFVWSLVWSNKLFPIVLDFLTADSTCSSTNPSKQGSKASSDSSTAAAAFSKAASRAHEKRRA